ncbi:MULTISPECIES: hypothetical protein [Francisella]|uniref:Uncharacterized protein n=1 Tax=Francisella opportunistica TaxID=2016517 RepID=A0A345JR14_9GAMM|nr:MULTISPECIES: hypothetical protein [Francisella]APC91477.1 hypothetical protein BBG19_0741 [Francisella sp. MA067296]AXH29760.1 hypothetical protein CGC43_03775 [Francisella opportunistica]AXH31410.1 hypothetical protein CGC44_03740 [Francisella opportunistica]AXH33056.1 hypothetical protein CGC45_03760 [Francisella opportunistica]
MKFERLLFLVIFISICSLCYAYYVKDNGKKITVSKKVANTIDDIEIQDGEALSQQQIINIIQNNSASTEEL